MKKILRCMVIFGIVILTACFTAGVMYAQDHSVTLTWEPQNPKMNETVKFSVSAPGAEKVRMFLHGMYHTFDGDHGTLNFHFTEDRIIDVTASALYNGVWTPKLPVKTINFADAASIPRVNAAVPSSIALSSSLPVSFTKIANVESYSYCIYPVDEYCRINQRINADDYSGQTISKTFDDTKDLPAGMYIFRIYVSDPGYLPNESHYLFEIGNSSQSLPPAPTVSIGKNQYILDEPLDISITADGASKYRYIESYPAGLYKSSSYDIGPSFYAIPRSGDHTVQFSVMIDGKWSAYSDPVQFTIVSNGIAPVTNFSIPETAESGGILSVSIEPAANVDRYYVSVVKSNEGSKDYCGWANVTTVDQPVEISLDNAEPGDYAVSVECYKSGYESIYRYRYFTVTPSDFVLPANLTAINSYAFSNAGMKSVTIPKNIITVSAYAFEGCNNLTSVSISNGPSSIGEYAFANNPKLTKVTIPNSVQSIADSAFSNCSQLTTITVYEGSYAQQWAIDHGFSVSYL